MNTQSKSKSTFTLIELLVVVAIISILASLLLPALSRARSAARGTTCLNQQRQLGMYMQLYAEDNDDRFPVAWTGTINWASTTLQHYQYQGDIGKAYVAFRDDNKVLARCPERQFSNDFYRSKYSNSHWWIMYGFNYVYLSNTTTAPTFSRVTHPSATVIATDSTAETGNGQIINALWSGGFPSGRHNDRTNALWVDLHVSAMPLNDMVGATARDTYYKAIR